MTPELRQKAAQRFAELGFPTTHDEDWRFTNVAPIAKVAWGKPGPGQPNGYPRIGKQLVFVNGRFAPELSSTNLPASVKATNLAAANGAILRPLFQL